MSVVEDCHQLEEHVLVVLVLVVVVVDEIEPTAPININALRQEINSALFVNINRYKH